MEVAKTAHYARSLYDALGDRAELEAAQKAKQCQGRGDEAEAETWHAVRKVISEIRGARQS